MGQVRHRIECPSPNRKGPRTRSGGSQCKSWTGRNEEPAVEESKETEKDAEARTSDTRTDESAAAKETSSLRRSRVPPSSEPQEETELQVGQVRPRLECPSPNRKRPRTRSGGSRGQSETGRNEEPAVEESKENEKDAKIYRLQVLNDRLQEENIILKRRQSKRKSRAMRGQFDSLGECGQAAGRGGGREDDYTPRRLQLLTP